jgi:hypothetical protein
MNNVIHKEKKVFRGGVYLLKLSKYSIANSEEFSSKLYVREWSCVQKRSNTSDSAMRPTSSTIWEVHTQQICKDGRDQGQDKPGSERR